jgi:hypothetical protein
MRVPGPQHQRRIGTDVLAQQRADRGIEYDECVEASESPRRAQLIHVTERDTAALNRRRNAVEHGDGLADVCERRSKVAQRRLGATKRPLVGRVGGVGPAEGIEEGDVHGRGTADPGGDSGQDLPDSLHRRTSSSPMRRLSPAPAFARTRRPHQRDVPAWRGGRVVECTALEMRHTGNRIGSSNLPLSAILLRAARFAELLNR